MLLLRRLIACSCFLALLTANGAGVFHWVRYTPRCTIDNPGMVRHLSSDGRWFVCLTLAQTKEISEGVAFADCGDDGFLVGIELLAPCRVDVLESASVHEPEQVRQFLRSGVRKEMIFV